MKKYGLIGYPLSHSFSQKYFTEKFKKEGLENYSYDNFQLKDLDHLKEKIKENNLAGFNITIPHKQSVVSFLDFKDDVVAKINACNCVKIDGNKWLGYNTDVIGFQKSFSVNLLGHHSDALILGTGGSSKAIAFVLKKLNINFLFVSTSKTGENIIGYDKIDAQLLKKYTIVINTTPVGMYPNINECPQLLYQFITDKHYFFDLTYNPAKTLFLKKAEQHGAIIKNGSDMLIIQAEESWKIWNSV